MPFIARIKASAGHLAKSFSTLYQGAGTSRDRTTIGHTPTDSKYDLTRWTRTDLMAKARTFYANDGFTRGAIRDLAQYSVGGGLIPQAQTDDEAWNDAAEAYWREWCKVADVTGKLSFNRLQRILSIAIDRDGDVGLMLVKTASGWPQIQLVEAHRIGSDSDIGTLSDGWVDGVKLDKVGRPIAYRIVEGDVMGARTYRDVPASDFIHLFDAERCDQVRGVTALYHAINTIHDKQDILKFEKMGVKNAAAFLAVLKKKNGKVDASDWGDGEDDSAETGSDATALAKMLAGQIPVIGKDDSIEDFPRDRPSPAFQGFLEFLIREVATGLGLPYEFVWNPEKLGGTSQRFVLAKAQRRFAERQELIIGKVLDRLWFWVISVGIKRGDLPKPRADLPVWRVKWQLPAELTVDAGRDASADREDVKMGLMTEAEHFARRGLDWKTERRQKEREVDDLLTRATALAKKHNVSVQVALTLLQQTTPNGITFNLSSQSDAKQTAETQEPQKPQKQDLAGLPAPMMKAA